MELTSKIMNSEVREKGISYLVIRGWFWVGIYGFVCVKCISIRGLFQKRTSSFFFFFA